ncbi:uncharacterized protein [Triticum aestivum]|uniref:uncharacterized protein n=1 Tax=Triticum aestivum TaxID=4565 RepID=UPI001D01B951|nr:uncharacterized protein LOC123068697 [Triticum aestivum]
MLAQQFLVRPRSQAHALDRVMAAVLAIKLLEEHLIPRRAECLARGKAPVPGKTPDSSTSSPDSSPDRDDPDPVVAATEALAKVDLSDDPDTTATAKSGSSKPRQAARGGGGDVGKSLDYMYCACRIARREAHRHRRLRPLPLHGAQEARQPRRVTRTWSGSNSRTPPCHSSWAATRSASVAPAASGHHRRAPACSPSSTLATTWAAGARHD